MFISVYRRFKQFDSSTILFSHSRAHSLLFNSLSLDFLTNFFFSCLIFFYRPIYVYHALKKKGKLTISDISICLAISLETCHVNNNAQLYTIRPSFTAAYSVFSEKYASRFTNPDSNLEFSRAFHATTGMTAAPRPGSRSTRAKLRSIDRCQSIERKWTLNPAKRNEKRDDETRTKTDTTKFPYKTSLSSSSPPPPSLHPAV